MPWRSRPPTRPGVGVIVGWSLGYVGLLGVVVAIIIVANVILVGAWLVTNIGW